MRLETKLSAVGVALLSLIFASPAGFAADEFPEPVLLWPDGAPGAMGEDEDDRPTIRIYQPAAGDSCGAAVVVCPGGGYRALATDHEGHQVAKWFNTLGVTAAVLKYRLGPKYKHPAPLNDVSRAIRYMRANAGDLGIDPARIGVMGFSAGGHLASTVSTHFDDGQASDDPLEKQSSRPDFAVLAYPVISLDAPFAHKGSGVNLLGENPDPELLKSLSNDTQVTERTPPTFLFHTGADKGVPVQNSLVYYRALVEHNVLAELHVYQNGPHGVGLAPGDPVLSLWKDRLADWLRTNGFLTQAPRAAVKGKATLDGAPLRWGTITFVPKVDPRLPDAFAMIGNGQFSIPIESGPAGGVYTVRIYNLGTVEPRPTIADAYPIMPVDGAGHSALVCEIKAGDNEFDFALTGADAAEATGPAASDSN